jgi:hypothetical protein
VGRRREHTQRVGHMVLAWLVAWSHHSMEATNLIQIPPQRLPRQLELGLVQLGVLELVG